MAGINKKDKMSKCYWPAMIATPWAYLNMPKQWFASQSVPFYLNCQTLIAYHEAKDPNLHL